jgi:hypothetical protein
MGKAIGTNGGEEECIYNIGGKARKKETLGRPRRRCVNNIKLDLRDIGWSDMDWIVVDQAKERSCEH